MAKISEKAWKRYADRLAQIEEKAAEELRAYLAQGGLEAGYGQGLNYAYALVTKYGEASSALACQMYDAVAELYNVVVPPAEPAATPTLQEVARTMRGAMDRTPADVPPAAGRMVKQTAADTTLQNAARDGAQFAWIPGGDACAFCRMLASNGWQHQGKKGAKAHAEHIHNNCRCQYAVRFDSSGGVGGYDPDKYLLEYKNADGETWQEKINAERRADYAENADEINAQKRTAYAARKEREEEQRQKTGTGRGQDENQKTKRKTGTPWSDDNVLGINKAIGQEINGTKIEWLSNTLEDEMMQRHVSAESVLNAITSPLSIKATKTDDLGRRSFQVIGEKATFALDPDTGVLTTAWPTSHKIADRLKKG